MNQKEVIVTGGMGYIGSHTTVALQNAGYSVFILDNLSNSDIGVLDGIYRITGVRPGFKQLDCTDISGMRRVFEKHYNAVGVIHFAAHKAVGESVSNPLMYYRNNLNGLINVLDMMGMFGIPNLVFSSSATVYGQPDSLPVTEDTPLKPATSAYGQTKVMGENIITDAVRANPGIRATLLRYFNPIGAHPSGEIGERPNGVPNNLMPYICQVAAGQRECLNIFGNDYDTPDGYCVRDYLDINDLADAHVAAMRHLQSGGSGVNVYNLGTGRGQSVMQLVDAFQRATGVNIPYKITSRRAGDVSSIYANADRAARELNWRAVVPLHETLASAWRWQKKLAKSK